MYWESIHFLQYWFYFPAALANRNSQLSVDKLTPKLECTCGDRRGGDGVGWISYRIHFGSKKTLQIWLGTGLWNHAGFSTHVVDTRSHSQFGSPTHHWSPFQHEGAFKAICLPGLSFYGLKLHHSLLYNSLQISLFYSTLLLSLHFFFFFFFLAHPWLNMQKKVTFLGSDFHACSMLGRHFQFPKTFHVTHPSTRKTPKHFTPRFLRQLLRKQKLNCRSHSKQLCILLD